MRRALSGAEAFLQMRHPLRPLGALLSLGLNLALLVSTLLYGVVGTPGGRGLLREETNGVVTRLLGPNVTAELGDPTIGFLADGNLAVAWSDVSVTRRGARSPASKIRSIRLGVSLPPLLEGRLHVDTLDIAGAVIDIGGARAEPQSSAVLPAAAAEATGGGPGGRDARFLPAQSARLIAEVENRIRGLLRLGLGEVGLSDITLVLPAGRGGAPFVARIDRADFALADPGALTLKAALEAGGLAMPLDVAMRYDEAAARLVSVTAALGPVPLRDVIPPAPPQDRLDLRPFATDAKASMRFDLATRPQDGLRTMRLALDLGEGAVQAGRGHTRIEAAQLGLRYVEGEDAIALDPGRLAFDGVYMTVSGKATPLYDGPAGAGFNGFGFEVGADDLGSTVGSTGASSPLTAALRLEGRTNTAAGEIVLSRFSLQAGHGRLGGDATVRFATPEARTVLRIAAAGLTAGEVKAFWPFNLASNTRRWIIEHLGDRGVVRTGTVALDLRHDRLAEAFKPDNHPEPAELDLRFELEDVAMKTFGDLPDLVALRGRVHTAGGDTLVSIDAGKAAGFASVDVGASTVSFVRAEPGRLHEVDGTLDLALAGDLPELLAIAAREPLNALRAVAIDPAKATGRASADARLAFVLGDAIPKERQLGPWSLALDLDHAGLRRPIEGRTLSDVSGPVRIVPGTASGEVEGSIDGFPARISFVQPFGANPLGQRRLAVAASLSGNDAAERLPALKGVVDGPIAISLVRDEDGDLKAAIDLSAASLKLATVGWRKGKGIPAAVAFDVVTGDGRTSLKNLTVKGDGFAAKGTVVADADGLRSAELSDVILNPGDDVGVSVQRVDNGFSVRIRGDRFDARPLLNDLKADLGGTANSKASARRQLDIGVAIRRLTGFGDREMRDFSLDFAGSGGEVAALSLSGRSGKSDAFTVDVSPRGKARSIRIRAPDAGALAEFTGLYGRMKDGVVTIDLLGSADGSYRGKITAEDFTLVNEPRLSRLVGSSPSPTSASLSKAVGADLKTENAFFDHASAGIVYGRNGLEVSDGIIRGPVFGSSFSGVVYDARNRIDIVGSFMPAYGVNRVFGAIPLLGQILGNGNEGGLIGITYRLDGLFSAPKLTVNPISAIAPGIFRNIFAYQ